MRFDQSAVKVLSNYATINKTMFFFPGNVISTATALRTILARAPIKEPIPREFAIPNLPMLVNVLKLFKEPTLDIEPEGEDEVLVVQEGDKSARVTLAAPHLINKPSQKEVNFSPDVTFKIPATMVQTLMSAASTFGHTELIFRSKNGKIQVETVNISNPTTDKYITVLGTTDKKFKVPLKLSNFLVMSFDYDAIISFPNPKERAAFFHLKSPDVEYFMPAEKKELEIS